jgi:hypothetical protein
MLPENGKQVALDLIRFDQINTFHQIRSAYLPLPRSSNHTDDKLILSICLTHLRCAQITPLIDLFLVIFELIGPARNVAFLKQKFGSKSVKKLAVKK